MNYTGFTILVVDDDQDDVEIFCEAIQSISSSINCLMTYTGKAALSLLGQLKELPKIIFMDCNMPSMDGGTCLSLIRKDERLKDIPVVMYSTSFPHAESEKFKQMGAYVLKKEVEFKVIVQKIRSMIELIYPDLKNQSQK